MNGKTLVYTGDTCGLPSSCENLRSGWYIAREFRLYIYMDLNDSDGSITARELLWVEVVDYVFMRAYMKFYLI